MGVRQRRWAVRARARLVQDLGGRCAECGSADDLEIDHKHGRDYDVAELGSAERVCRYRREARAGLLRVLCKPCNGRDGATRGAARWA